MKVYAVISQWMDCDGDWIDRRVEKFVKLEKQPKDTWKNILDMEEFKYLNYTNN